MVQSLRRLNHRTAKHPRKLKVTFVFAPSFDSLYIGRLAPSPTGAQHLGNARTFLIAWLMCRRAGGQLLLRIEDLETPRIKSWATEQAIEDLRWLGLDWDQTAESPFNVCEPLVQSRRVARYGEILQRLIDREAVYPCTCTRSEIEAIAAAPHESSLDGPVYPGTCAGRSAAESEELLRNGTHFAWRFRMPMHRLHFFDAFRGEESITAPDKSLGDFVVARMNGTFAYQLAVVIDDHDTFVNQVVRGDDLVLSTYRQLAIYQHLDWTAPRFCHLPLVVGKDGRRLAKRHGDTRLATLRDAGISPQTIIGYLAFKSGLIERYSPFTPHDLLAIDPLANLSRTACILDSTYAVDFFKELQHSSPDDQVLPL